MKIQFLGAAGTVTGSKYLVASGADRVLVDCGLFQGLKQLRLRNRARLPFEPAAISAILLTHAHLDHSGHIPLLVKQGFRGRIYCTAATYELCRLLLPDSGHLQEEDAEYANRHGFSRHKPALPLYTQDDAERSLQYFEPIDIDRRLEVGTALTAEFRPAGHILGATSVRVDDGAQRVVFSGDVGRPHDPLMLPPRPLPETDYLVVESTYGDRVHPRADSCDELEAIVTGTIRRGGAVVVPSFAVGRAQALLYCIHRLKQQARIPRDLPVFLDSPMAVDVTRLYQRFHAQHRLAAAECDAVCRGATFVKTVDESRALSAHRAPMILIAASGMATGGRVVHHLKAFAPDARNTILFSGYQAAGTRGAAMIAGARTVRIHGQDVPVRAEVAALSTLSAHADCEELLAWLAQLRTPPRCTYITHGEPTAADALRQQVERRLRWTAHVPEHGASVDLAEPG